MFNWFCSDSVLALVLVFGGALIISAHRQRTGQRGSWPFKNFNSRERWLLRLLKLVVLIVGGVGLAMSQGAIG